MGNGNGAAPRSAPAEALGRTTQSPQLEARHAAMASLSPAVAQSLARLAGKADAPPSDVEDALPRVLRSKAAE
jgi:hypothetical protein